MCMDLSIASEKSTAGVNCIENRHLDAFAKHPSGVSTSICDLRLVGSPMIHPHLETALSQLLCDLDRSQLLLEILIC